MKWPVLLEISPVICLKDRKDVGSKRRCNASSIPQDPKQQAEGRNQSAEDKDGDVLWTGASKLPKRKEFPIQTTGRNVVYLSPAAREKNPAKTGDRQAD